MALAPPPPPQPPPQTQTQTQTQTSHLFQASLPPFPPQLPAYSFPPIPSYPHWAHPQAFHQWPIPIYHPLPFPTQPIQHTHTHQPPNTTKTLTYTPQTNPTHTRPSPHRPTSPNQPRDKAIKSEGVKHSFRIDAKTFFFCFLMEAERILTILLSDVVSFVGPYG